MNKTYPVSILIPTLNEAENLAELLPLLTWAAEIVVVDSLSEDATAAVVAKAGGRLLSRAYTTPSEQKNWAIPQCTCDWVLIFDADERPTAALIAEVQNFMEHQAANSDFDGFWIGRTNHFLGQQIRHSGWRGDAVIRLIRRDRCRYNDKRVHEEITQKGLKIGHLSAKMSHFTYKNLAHFLAKMQRYADWAADDYAAKTPRVGLWHLWIKPLFRFVKHYFIQLGFLDGRAGFVVSSLMAWGVFLRYATLLERQRGAAKK
jgi:glycosyltransferase involved in cell wall biosynthesis